MKTVTARHIAAITVIVLATAFRIVGVGYGQPFWLVNDEMTLVGGALRMIELRNPIPSMNPGPMGILYYPPGLPWLFLVIWAPVISLQWILSGFPSTSEFANILLSNLTPIWLAARLSAVALSVATVFVVMRLVGGGLRSHIAGILAGLLLATSFHHGMMGHFARSWAPAVFLMWWGIWAAWRIYTDDRRQDYVWAAFAAGLGFAVNYVGILVLLSAVAAHALRHRRIVIDRSILLYATIVIAFIAIIAAASWPNFLRFMGYSAIGQLIPGSADRGANSAIEFVSHYYIATLYKSDALLAIIGLFGLPVFVRAAPALAIIVGATLVPYTIILLTGYAHEDRYILPITPVFAIGAAALVLTKVHLLRRAVIAVIAFIILVQAAILARLDYVMSRPDTRVEARRWIYEHVPAGEGVVAAIQPVLFEQSLASVALEQELAPEKISYAQRRRLAGTKMLSGGSGQEIDAIDLRQVGSTALQQLGGERLISRLWDEGYRWYVVDDLVGRGIDKQFKSLLAGRLKQVEVINPGPAGIQGPIFNLTDQFEHGHAFNVFRISRLGPTVRIFRIESP